MPTRRKSNVLTVPSIYGSGVAVPQVLPDRRQILASGGSNSLEVPGSGSLRQMFQQQGCCPCPPQSQRPYAPQGQPPGANPGLGQPSTPQKPFQTVPQDPCEMVREQLGRMGLTPEMLNDCLKPRRQSTSRRKPTKRKKPARRRMAPTSTKRKRPSRKKKPARRVTASGGATYKLFRNPRTGKSVCRNQRTNKFVKRSFCK